MADHEWTPAIGLRNATLSLLWRFVVTALLWLVALWAFHAALDGIGVTRVPKLIVAGFGLLMGTIAGFVISKGLDERAGFVGPLLALLAAGFAGVAIIGGEALFAHFFPVAETSLRYLIVGITMVVACAWIVKHALLGD